jgi:hypothetical protein
VLWVALLINAAMFGVELWGGLGTGSVSLPADAIDFFGDAANVAISLLVLGMALRWRARAALLKGLVMGGFGLFVLGRAAWSLGQGGAHGGGAGLARTAPAAATQRLSGASRGEPTWRRRRC